MGLLKEVGKLAAKQGSYLRGYNDAIEGRPRKAWKVSNKEEYDKGYDDGLKERMISATDRRNE
jgi:hypothetical protein